MKRFELVDNENEATAITHNGKFHIDDIFSTVLLINTFDNVKLARVSEVSDTINYNSKIIFDIGKGKFDHHQVDAATRENGIKYSSFGLLWKEYGRKYLEKINCKDIEFAWRQLDNSLVKTIDKIDNFQIEEDCLNNYLISNIIENFNPIWNSDMNSNDKFRETIEFAMKIFDNEVSNILSRVEAKFYLENKNIENNKYIVLEKYIPYNDFILEHDMERKIEFVIYPSNRNGYEVRTVLNRKTFPKEWSKLSKKEFFDKYQVEGFLYCHPNGKLCISENIQSAIDIIELT